MAGSSNDDRSSMAIAMRWVSQITTISLEMVLPAGLGYWLDGQWGTDPWLVASGAVLGLIIAMKHLLQIASESEERNGPPSGGSES